MTMILSGDGTITGLVAGGLPNATVTADDLAAGAALNNAPNSVGFRNRIINGDMRIDQRNAGAAVTAPNSFPVDRFTVTNSTDGAFSAQQDSDSPVGFTNSVKITTTTADATLTTTQSLALLQNIEGFNTADLAFGSASAKTVTLSFWVKSSLTGTFGGSLRNNAFNRSYPFTYLISAADTFEYKTVEIEGDTSGTWLTTTGRGIQVFFGLGAGPDRSGTAGAWNSNSNLSATGAVSVIGTLNATWFVTGVQLEVGSVATPFERRPFGTELSLCQRYFQVFLPSVQEWIYNESNGASNKFWQIYIPITMRSSPTATYNSMTGGSVAGLGGTISSVATSAATVSRISARVTMSTTGGADYNIHHTDSFSGDSVNLSSEL